jgi:hypothetical protein
MKAGNVVFWQLQERKFAVTGADAGNGGTYILETIISPDHPPIRQASTGLKFSDRMNQWKLTVFRELSITTQRSIARDIIERSGRLPEHASAQLSIYYAEDSSFALHFVLLYIRLYFRLYFRLDKSLQFTKKKNTRPQSSISSPIRGLCGSAGIIQMMYT